MRKSEIIRRMREIRDAIEDSLMWVEKLLEDTDEEKEINKYIYFTGVKNEKIQTLALIDKHLTEIQGEEIVKLSKK